MTAPADALTVPCEGIGVWEGARVRAQTLRYGEVSCTVVRRTIGMASGWWDVILDGLHVVSVHTDDMRLDLTHRPTRLEAMARLAGRVGVDTQAAAVWVCDYRGFWALAAGICAVEPRRSACSAQIDAAFSHVASTFSRVLWWPRYAGWPEWDKSERHVPALADLDPTDDTRLPDGARMVDVRALAIVLRHVFGVPR